MFYDSNLLSQRVCFLVLRKNIETIEKEKKKNKTPLGYLNQASTHHIPKNLHADKGE